jgi:hypothetical protein
MKNQRKIPIKSTKFGRGRILLPTIVLIENSPCTFQGNMPDQDNCHCKQNKKSTIKLIILFSSI